MKKLLKIVSYPLLLLIALAIEAQLLHTNIPIGITVAIAVIPLMLGIWGLEMISPYTRSWRPTLHQFLLDFCHSLLSANAAGQLTRIALASVMATVGAFLAAKAGSQLWPTQWPLWLQLPLAILVADFGVYWAHRWMHLSRLGWRLHAVHHTPTKLYFLAAGRTHPFNAVISHGAEIIPLIVLGSGPELFALWTVFKTVNGVLQHSNIDLTPGWLNRILATNEQHWHHHSQERTPSNSNFGNTTMIWDQLFGTYYTSDERPSPIVGIAGAEIPEHYLAHLSVPFTLRQYQPSFDQQSV
jgi:ornithine lipid hydroxylase